jgi:hypothetical protein
VIITPLDGSSTSYPFTPGVVAKWAGVSTGQAPVPQTSNLIKLLTAKRGRSYRGRIYLPWLDETVQDSGHVAPATITATTAAWVAFWTALNADGAPLQVASYKNATSEAVIALACENFVGTQRKRNRRNSTTG